MPLALPMNHMNQWFLVTLLSALSCLQTAIGADTIHSSSLGLSLDVPDGTQQTGASQPGQPAFVLLREGRNQPRWSMRIERIISASPTPNELLLELIGNGRADDQGFEILDRQRIQIHGKEGSTTWINESQPNGSSVVFGWLVLPTARNDYLVITVITLPTDWKATQAEMRPIFQSIEVQDPTLLALDRNAMLKRGQEVIKGITEEDLRKLVGFKELRRIYRPGLAATDTEIGYSLIEVAEAPRGMVKRHRNPERYSKEEQEEGLLVIEHSRIVADADRQVYVDLLSLQWLSWDLQREAWTITATRRQGEARATETEVGFRTEPSLSSPRPTLHVIKQDDEIGLREPYQWTLPDGWLPRPLSSLVSRLIPHEQQQMAFVVYDHTSTVPSLTLRMDQWSRDTDMSDRWVLESRVGEQGFPTRVLYDRSANLLRLAQPGGNTIEPSTVAEIQRRWDQAGLKTE